MIRNTANQSVGAQMVDLTTGAPYVGTVTVYITGDAGTQAIGTVGSGICTAEGNGYYSYRPSQAETDYLLIAFTFTGTGAIPTTLQVDTLTLAQFAALSAASMPGAITYRDLITAALKRIGVVGAGQTAAPEDVIDSLQRMNGMIDMFATERLLIPAILRTTWTIVSGTGTYTVGSGGAVDVARPVYLEDVRFIDTSLSTPLEMPLGNLFDQGYANIPMKTFSTPYPQRYYWNPTFTGTGLASLVLDPIPTSSTLTGVLYAPSQLPLVGSLNTTVVLQPGYRWFLQESLAVALIPEFGVPPPQGLQESAREAKANIKRANIRLIDQATTAGYLFGGRGYGYSIWSDR